jgi:hypothetical protein
MLQQRKSLSQFPIWKFCSSIYRPRKHFTLYRDEKLGVQLEVMVKRNWVFFPPREKQTYFIDGVNRVFTKELKLMRALAILNVGKRILRLSTSSREQAVVTQRVGLPPKRVATG